MKNFFIFLLVLGIFSNHLFAQKFMSPYSQGFAGKGYLVKNNGEKIGVNFKTGLFGTSGLMWINAIDTLTGVKTKYKVDANIPLLNVSKSCTHTYDQIEFVHKLHKL